MSDGVTAVYEALLRRRRERLECVFAAIERAADCADSNPPDADRDRIMSVERYIDIAENCVTTVCQPDAEIALSGHT